MKKSLPISFAVVIVLLFITCDRDWENPFHDSNTLDPEAWAPQNFEVEDVTITEKKLTWTYEDRNIEGFKLDRKKGDEPWQVGYQAFSRETRSWNDTEIIPDPSLTYSYRLYAYAGINKSAEKSLTESAAIPQPTDLQLEKLSDISYKLTWQDNSTGEEGFKIDRKTADTDWVIGYGTVAENITAFVDTSVFVDRSSINVEYRVYAFYKEYESAKTTESTIAALTPPTNLTIAKNTITSVTLNWQDNSTGEEGFKIERKYATGDWVCVATTTGTSWQDNDFKLNTIVYYRVNTYVGNYASGFAENSFDASIPPPTNLQITQNTISSVTLNWQANSTGEEGFKIERKQGTGNWELLTALPGTSYTDEAFELNSDISYRIATYHGQYHSDFIEDSFNSQIPAPENLTHAASITSVTFNWDYGFTGHEGFKIDRKINNGSWELEFAILNAIQNNYTDNSINLQTNEYTYRVYSFVNLYQSSSIEQSVIFKVGMNGFGGIIFYIDGNGGGLVCAESDQSIAQWGCQGTTIGGTVTGIGTGASNTAKIVSGCSQSGIAARICNDLVLNGYSDWFLPSKDELNLMYQNLKLNGIGGFTENLYWSSSEHSSLSSWRQSFSSGGQNSSNKSNHLSIRAVRAF